MKIIGLCGGSGSGKGTVADFFSAFGVPSVDTDAIYHRITAGYTPCVAELISAFGSGILRSDGGLDRRKLAAIIFSGDDKIEKQNLLNSITHKYVLSECDRIFTSLADSGCRFALLDAPLFYEAGLEKKTDTVIAVIADREIRISRIVARDGISFEEAARRIDAQIPDGVLRARADYCIVNNGTAEELREEVRRLAEIIIK